MTDHGPRNSPNIERLDEAECLRLIGRGGVGRLGFVGRYGVSILPVNFTLHEGGIVFRTARHSPLEEDLRTGIAGAEHLVAFEIDHIDEARQEGWSVLVQGPAHHLEAEAERAAVMAAIAEPWPGGEKEALLRIIPSRITGRRIVRPA
jgi:nitroimidazol reductase NimA-like FMN-containing flavoprotein (pyridoxamine 5'-phosphate oxidase superfamily)